MNQSYGSEENNTGNHTRFHVDTDGLSEQFVIVRLVATYVIFIAGLILNVSILSSLFMYRNKNNISEFLFFLLTLNDTVYCIWHMVFYPFNVLKIGWIVGQLMCRVNKVIRYTLFFLPLILMTTMSYERFRSIVYQSPVTFRRVKIWVASSVVVLISAYLPAIFLWDPENLHRSGRCISSVEIRDPRLEAAYVLFCTLLVLGFPGGTIIYNCKILRHNKRRRRQVNAVAPQRDFSVLDRHHLEMAFRNRAKSSIRTAKALVIINCIVIASYAFHFCTRLTIVVNDGISLYNAIDLVSYLVFNVSYIYDPVVYLTINSTFRKRLGEFICLNRRKSSNIVYIGRDTMVLEN
uniref:Rhodopsin, GQ-coupled-like n=1 Tax=Saccoglossus kowalevskii TaxID=10224 RepID=A0ABM0MSW7_SACKO|nr:PREDICTED: rhodopsin, GQ-coupled-like [Saccoglossus kowalevskii]